MPKGAHRCSKARVDAGKRRVDAKKHVDAEGRKDAYAEGERTNATKKAMLCTSSLRIAHEIVAVLTHIYHPLPRRQL